MAGFSELIKNFDKTRDYVREFFIYGFKVRSDFDRKSARTYDDEKRRIESWLGDYLRCDTTSRGKQAAITLNSARISENPLYRAFESRSFTDNDIRLHFLLLDILSGGGAYSVRALTEQLVSDYGAVFDEQTVRGKLREYAAEGILIPERTGKTILYRLTPETPQALFTAFPALKEAVKFFSCLSEFGFAGHTLLRAAGLHNHTFLMKHNYIVHTLEEEVLLQLTDAIREKRMVTLFCFGRKRTDLKCTVIPLQIYASAQTGRRYLICFQPDFRRMNSYRLDYIRKAKDAGACNRYAEYAAMLERNAEKCFGVSFGHRKQGVSEHTVHVTMQIDMAHEPYILERLQREKRCGHVERTGEDLCTFTVTVFDANEIMNWVKTYIGRIVSISGAPAEEMQFRRDVERMHRMYCKKEAKEAADGTVQ